MDQVETVKKRVFAKHVFAGQMTVGQLREKLAAVPAHYVVFSEGCDCVGPSDNISVDDKDECVTLDRNDGLKYEEIYEDR